MAQLHHPFRAGQIAQLVTCPDRSARHQPAAIDDQILSRARQHGLATVGQIAQPRGAVDRRTDVIAFVAQLHLAGVHADAQPDRGQRRPLQLQRSTPPRRLARANATTKLSPSPCSTGRTPPWAATRSGSALIQPRERRGHLARAGSPTAASNPRRQPTAASPCPSAEARSRPTRSSPPAACPHGDQSRSC